MWEQFLPQRAVGHWNRLPRAVLESPALEGWTDGHEVLRTWGSARGGLWLDSLILRVFSSLNDSVILC